MQFSNVVLLCLSMACAVFAHGKCDVTRNKCNVSTGNEPIWIKCHDSPLDCVYQNDWCNPDPENSGWAFCSDQTS
ncbi:uncharacterized protein MYCGRDRAFT_104383 [Zymoseptoria tritici IPO323]|uniref:AvrStb6 n=1 Tax=Zymoseptoria tritici (strain CBS 115943 / IPO323) TaxID=336722 RepID=F9XAU1_ZYMTI|nr:uncharacterized protein MYCGRDRAFT_104383 [Zymoseptoria tritici IPO323]EGP87059.1 hypothetical protein MYCGRDRAFT_104383 [Zymoseptoria tritici IPO323]